MFDDTAPRISNGESFTEIERINNGFIVSSIKGKVHCRTFNGLVRALELLYKTKMLMPEDLEKESQIAEISN